MFNVLIVDDDRTTVEVIRDTVRWEQMEVRDVFTAFNIRQAQQILEREPVDLVISDIEMPMGSGLDLLRWFRERDLKGEFLLLTCHEDFGYASDALRNRAAEYLLKPFDAEVMEAAVRRILQRVRENRQKEELGRYGQWMQENRAEVQLSFLRSLLEGEFEGSAERLAQELQTRRIPLAADGRYALILGQITEFEKDEQRFGRELCLFALRNLFSEVLCGTTENDRVVCFDRQKVLLTAAVCDAEETERMEERCRALLDNCAAIFTGIVTLCVCRPCALAELYETWQRGSRRIAAEVAQYGSWFSEEKEPAAERTTAFPDEQTLEKGMTARDKRGLLQYLSGGLEEEKSAGQLNLRLLQRCRQSLLQTAYAEFARCGVRASGLIDDESAQELYESAVRSLTDFIRWSSFFLTRAFAALDQGEERESLSDRVQEYIREHYAEDISRSSIAEAFYLSPEYLGKLFKKETGRNLKDAISEFRIGRACALLTQTDLRIGEIALEVGFESFAYFSTMFRKYTGMTPNEYRKQRRDTPEG